ncbi:uncharacterized protein LOC129589477 [Paramacrobiotus metropolitanus]|uniref:uncharacterized protein LOC129589477 n=1 Tax=Paramacrobiotus metropolitanus TaxID=2943436 RepID=UPI0024465C9A|nr:uncharacterized protein LOC129589477 [Paramacrobiotus metropolitanus]
MFTAHMSHDDLWDAGLQNAGNYTAVHQHLFALNAAGRRYMLRVFHQLARVSTAVQSYFEARRGLEADIVEIGKNISLEARGRERECALAAEEAGLLASEERRPSNTRQRNCRTDPNEAYRWCMAYLAGNRTFASPGKNGQLILQPYAGAQVDLALRAENWTRVLASAQKTARNTKGAKAGVTRYAELHKLLAQRMEQLRQLDAVIDAVEAERHIFYNFLCRAIVGMSPLHQVSQSADAFIAAVGVHAHMDMDLD